MFNANVKVQGISYVSTFRKRRHIFTVKLKRGFFVCGCNFSETNASRETQLLQVISKININSSGECLFSFLISRLEYHVMQPKRCSKSNLNQDSARFTSLNGFQFVLRRGFSPRGKLLLKKAFKAFQYFSLLSDCLYISLNISLWEILKINTL